MSIAFLEEDFAPPPPPRKGVAWLAWLVILLAVFVVVFGADLLPRAPDDEAQPEAPALDLVVLKLQARSLVGAANMQEAQPADLLEQIKPLDRGSTKQRLAYVTLVGELAGPKEARAALKKLLADKPFMTPQESELFIILDRLYRDFEQGKWLAPSLTEKQKDWLRAELEWFGDLALAPKPVANLGPEGQALRAAALAPAQRTFLTMLGLVGGGMMVGFAGLAGLVVLLNMARRGRLRGGLRTGLPHGGVYAETFALWMLLFLGVSLALSRLPDEAPRLLSAAFGMLASLVALGWPCLRGIPWSQVRKDIGLTWGRQPLLESALGVATYAMSLPLLGVGIVGTYVIMAIQGQLPELGATATLASGAPIRPHPLFKFIVQGDWTVWLQVVFLACVVAPIVEETMFRGVLHRHLREATRRLRTTFGILLSTLLVSFLFAIVHPYGIVAVPMLMALASGFTVAREWRGSLVPCMIAHGISNGIVTLVAILALSD